LPSFSGVNWFQYVTKSDRITPLVEMLPTNFFPVKPPSLEPELGPASELELDPELVPEPDPELAPELEPEAEPELDPALVAELEPEVVPELVPEVLSELPAELPPVVAPELIPEPIPPAPAEPPGSPEGDDEVAASSAMTGVRITFVFWRIGRLRRLSTTPAAMTSHAPPVERGPLVSPTLHEHPAPELLPSGVEWVLSGLPLLPFAPPSTVAPIPLLVPSPLLPEELLLPELSPELDPLLPPEDASSELAPPSSTPPLPPPEPPAPASVPLPPPMPLLPLPLLPLPLPVPPGDPPSPHAATCGSGPFTSVRPKKSMTEVGLIGVVCPPPAWVCASRTVNPQEFCHFSIV
jgi:hypothetical protein